MDLHETLIWIAKASYFLAAVLFILGIKRMASPVTARKGIVQPPWLPLPSPACTTSN